MNRRNFCGRMLAGVVGVIVLPLLPKRATAATPKFRGPALLTGDDWNSWGVDKIYFNGVETPHVVALNQADGWIDVHSNLGLPDSTNLSDSERWRIFRHHGEVLVTWRDGWKTMEEIYAELGDRPYVHRK